MTYIQVVLATIFYLIVFAVVMAIIQQTICSYIKTYWQAKTAYTVTIAREVGAKEQSRQLV